MVTEQEARDSLQAVFAAGVATRMREGLDRETATRQTHAAIKKQLEDSLTIAKERGTDDGAL